MLDMREWMAEYIDAVRGAFGERVRFIGLQGSRGRGEAEETSDIDVVLLLDRLDAGDLDTYRSAVEHLPARELLCGFVCGWPELVRWEKSDLLSLVLDTEPIYGDLSGLLDTIEEEDRQRAVLAGACGVYHACVHNLLHGRSLAMLRDLYKSAFFTIRTRHFLRTETYIATRRELLEAVGPGEREILLCRAEDLEEDSRRLLEWSKALINE